MRFPSSPLAWGLFAGTAQAQLLMSELSFGFGPRIAPERSRDVPNFQLMGMPYKPEILSNKIILTPSAPAPGNQRGAVWGERPLDKATWVADVDFRVSGPERGGGNLNIWLAKDGWHEVGTSSVYTAGPFEGLVLVLDAAGASSAAGSLRGYLNDGTKDFKALASASALEGLAFGHCDYPYRNLGRPSQIKIRQTAQTFSVEIDGQPCFASNDVVIPKGYRFGVSAASADTPDSAEIFKLVVTTDLEAEQQEQLQQQQQQQGGVQQEGDPQGGDQQAQQQFGSDGQVRITRGGVSDANAPPPESLLPDAEAESITSSKAQFADLHNRLQSVNHHLSTIYRQTADAAQAAEKRRGEVAITLGQMRRMLDKLDKLERLEMIEDKLEQLDRDMKALHGELRESVTHAEQSVMYHVTGHLAGHHDKLVETLKHPGHMKLILVIIGGQVCLGLSYYLYKRKRANSPKKYL